MKLANYGVVLNRLTIDKIEMVRNWRNNPKISQYMEFRDYITAEMQLQWFNSINNENNYYFIIEVKNESVGLINVKDIDYNKKVGEAGIYIFEDKHLNSLVSFASILCLFDFCFEKLNLDFLIAHILRTNRRAVKFNKMIGFELIDNQENVENQKYKLDKITYQKQKLFISNILNY